jgi:hypothetical protein
MLWMVSSLVFLAIAILRLSSAIGNPERTSHWLERHLADNEIS